MFVILRDRQAIVVVPFPLDKRTITNSHEKIILTHYGIIEDFPCPYKKGKTLIPNPG
jgi:hypothetical protein